MQENIFIKQRRLPVPSQTGPAVMLLIGLMAAIFFLPAHAAAGEFILNNTAVEENLPIGAAVGQFSVPGQSLVVPDWRLVPGEGDADNNAFIIEDNTLKTAAVFNFEARNTYSIRVKDEADQTEETFIIAVTDVNEAPELEAKMYIEGDVIHSAMYQNGPEILQTHLYVRDPEQDMLTWSVITVPGNGVTRLASLSEYCAEITYTPVPGFLGTDSFTVQVSDGSLTDTVTIDVDVRMHNDAPEITGGDSVTIYVMENSPFTTIDLYAEDAEDHALWWELATPPENGRAYIEGVGNSQMIYYTPDEWYTGTDSFEVQVSDFWSSDIITVYVNVMPPRRWTAP